MPWKEISKATLGWMGSGSPTSPEPRAEVTSGPHVAVGTIEYGGGQTGYLVYVKSSLTGDENDYILDYIRRNPNFPHETTSDQFFSEEQFEVYRALGFHAVNGFLDGSARVLVDAKLLKPIIPPEAAPPISPPPESEENAAPTETESENSKEEATDASDKATGETEEDQATPGDAKPSNIVPAKDPCLTEIRGMLGLK